MPDTIANNGTAVPDMSRAAAKAIYPNGGRNRTAARVQAALLRGLAGAGCCPDRRCAAVPHRIHPGQRHPQPQTLPLRLGI